MELVAVGEAVGRDSVRLRWRFNMHNVSFCVWEGSYTNPKIAVVLDGGTCPSRLGPRPRPTSTYVGRPPARRQGRSQGQSRQPRARGGGPGSGSCRQGRARYRHRHTLARRTRRQSCSPPAHHKKRRRWRWRWHCFCRMRRRPAKVEQQHVVILVRNEGQSQRDH